MTPQNGGVSSIFCVAGDVKGWDKSLATNNENPNGILQQSPGLARYELPWDCVPDPDNPERVAACGNGDRNEASTPLGL